MGLNSSIYKDSQLTAWYLPNARGDLKSIGLFLPSRSSDRMIVSNSNKTPGLYKEMT